MRIFMKIMLLESSLDAGGDDDDKKDDIDSFDLQIRPLWLWHTHYLSV